MDDGVQENLHLASSQLGVEHVGLVQPDDGPGEEMRGHGGQVIDTDVEILQLQVLTLCDCLDHIYMVQYIGANIIGGIFVKILKTTFCIYCIEVGW